MPLPPAFTLPAPPQVLTGREIYNSIMRQIEPELVTENLPKLQAVYAGEGEEQRHVRGERYRKAFIKYYEMFDIYVADMKERIKRYQRDAMQTVESASRWEEEQNFNTLSASLFTLT